MAADSVENDFREPCLRSVEVGDAVHDCDGLSLSTAGKQELWRFEKVEEEESAEKHGEGDCADGEHEVSPSPVSRVVWNEAPGNQGANQLTYRPPD